MKNKTLALVVFICGMATMTLELVGSRIFAPYVGTSIFVWTNLIGVILGFLSLGYAWGGKIADKNPNANIFSLIILGAAFWIILLGFISDPVLVLIQQVVHDVRAAALLAAIVLFGVPSTLLGMVSPYAVKLKTYSPDKAGSAVGELYALSTIGSIAGTFLAGFVLLSYFGNTLILFVLGALLILTALMVSRWAGKAKIFFFLVAVFLSCSSEVLAGIIRGRDLVDMNTPYSRVWIYDLPAQGAKTARIMQINDELSSMKILGSQELLAPYTKYYELSGHFYPNPTNALMLGGAGYCYPEKFLSDYPQAAIDVVEIDPGVTRLAEQYFDLKRDSRLTIYHEDARTYLNRNKKIYNLIFVDVFRSSSIPFHVTTKEAIGKMAEALDDDGILMMNVISSIEGETGEFVRAQIATLKTAFSQVYIYPVQDRDNAKLVQNLMVVALKSKSIPKFYSRDAKLNDYLSHLWINPIVEDQAVLTDDFAPVDRYSLRNLSGLSASENPIFKHWKRLFSQRTLFGEKAHS